jgi:hypothetical protein
MIITELYNGQGLGNQLWCYFVLRCIALKNNYEFGIQCPERFKGKDLMRIDFGNIIQGGSGPEGGPPQTLPININKYYKEKTVRHPNSGIDVSPLDENLLNIEDNTKIDGTMQSMKYIEPYREKIKTWFNLKYNFKFDELDENACLIHIRGGDFRFSSAFLEKDYYDNAINKMKEKNSNMKFYIITDDVNYVECIYPNIKILGGSYFRVPDKHKASHHIGGPIELDWSMLNVAKNVIMSASSFSFWPVWLNDDVYVIAPMYWAAHNENKGYWSCGDSMVKGWHFLNKNQELLTY